MRKAITYVALTCVGVSLITAAYFCQFYYTRYQSNVTDLEQRVSRFDMRLAALEGHKSRELRPVHVVGMISTTNQPADESMLFRPSPNQIADGYFEAANAKGGPFIRPEIRLSGGSATNSVFDIHVESQLGRVADAWLSHAAPFQDPAAFDEFHIYCPNTSNVVRLIARAKPGASVKLRFDVVILFER